jgi:hypothetical protein
MSDTKHLPYTSQEKPVNQMSSFKDISHDRDEDFEKEVYSLVSKIKRTINHSVIDLYLCLNSFSLKCNNEAMKRELMANISSEYDFKEASLSSRLSFKFLPFYLFRHYLFLIYSLIFSKKWPSHQKNFELILDGIETEREFSRYKDIFESFSEKVIVTNSDFSHEESEVFKYQKGKEVPLPIVIRQLFIEIFLFFTILIISIFKKANFYALHSRITNKAFESHTIYSQLIAPLIFQERHYQTSAIKNDIFKSYGGKFFTSYQKNIIQLGNNGMFYDMDVLFSLGTEGKTRIQNQGGRIDNIFPVGSLFMEHYFVGKEKPIEETEKYDIILIGYNIGDFQDSYSSYWSDYYEHFRWLVGISEKFPHLKIGIKHHPNNKEDIIEKNIIKGTRISYIEHDFSSYDYCMNANLCLTFGSTLAFEMGLLNKEVLFLDPGHRNSQYLPSEPELLNIRCDSYDLLEGKISLLFNNGQSLSSTIDWGKYILGYRNISEKITKHLKTLD